MKVKEWIETLKRENPEARVRYNIYWENEIELEDAKPAFTEELLNSIHVQLIYEESEDD